MTKKKPPPRNKKIYARSTQSGAFRPTPPSAPAEDVWRRIDTLLADNPAPREEAAPTKLRKRGEARRKKRLKRKLLILDALGSTTWIAIIAKFFVGDLDRLALSSFAPQAIWILDLRWFLVLVLAALLLLLFKSRTLGLGVAYVVAYPLVLLFWQLPKFLIRRRSPLVAIGLTGVVTSLAARAKLFIYALAIACLSGVMIVLSHTPWLVAIGMGAMFTVLIWWLAVTAIDSLRTTSFIRAQETVIKKLLDFHLIERFTTPKHPNRLSLKEWTVEDARTYRDSAGNTLLATRVLKFWAHSLDEYRKGPSVVILNALVVAGLLLQLIVVFSFLNYGAYSIDPAQFKFTIAPESWTFAYYAAAGAYFGEISALAPAAGLAIALKLLNGFIGAVVVLTIVASLFLGHRSLRSDATAISAIQLLRSKADELETMSDEQYQMDTQKLEEKLLATSWGLIGIAAWLSAKASFEWKSGREII